MVGFFACEPTKAIEIVPCAYIIHLGTIIGHSKEREGNIAMFTWHCKQKIDLRNPTNVSDPDPESRCRGIGVGFIAALDFSDPSLKLRKSPGASEPRPR